MWQTIVEFHRSAGWLSLVQFYGAIVGGVGVVILLIFWLRALSSAKKGRRRIQELVEDLKQMHRTAGEAEYRLEQKMNDRVAELEQRVGRKMDQKSDWARDRIEQTETRLSERMDERTSPVVAKMGSIETQGQELSRQVETFRHRVDEVEIRIPNLYDRLEEFRETLAKIFQSELGSVLESFDGSVTAVLNQMKTDLQMGITRIEGIEGMVRSRQRAEDALLGPLGKPELAEAPEAEEVEPEPEPAPAEFEERAEEALEEEAEPTPDFEDIAEEALEEEAEPEEQPEPTEEEGEEESDQL